jgi:hypothetical protein
MDEVMDIGSDHDVILLREVNSKKTNRKGKKYKSLNM